MGTAPDSLLSALDSTFEALGTATAQRRTTLQIEEVGQVTQVSKGVAFVDGLPDVQSEELLEFPGRRLGMAYNLDVDEVGVILLDPSEEIEAGHIVRRTGRVMDVAVGEALLGRVVDPMGRPLDGKGSIPTTRRLPVERPVWPIMDRSPVTTPLQTGIKVIDALVPIGRGQRELIIGDRQTGKTAIAVDTILNQKDYGVLCVYCAIGQRSSAVAKVIEDLRKHDALEYCVVVVTSGDDPAGLQFVAPYAAASMGEYFMEAGRDVLIVYDDLTRHARAHRELSLLLRRPPGREAFPGDVFYIHSRLLERATHLRAEHGGGSLSALPIVETQAQNMSAYIPTNLIGITDGQVYLSPTLVQQGVLPGVDVGKSVSRVGGKAQLPAYRSIAGHLKLSYSQFEELERFSRYGARLAAEQRKTIEHGRRVREVLKQPQYTPLTVGDHLAVLEAVVEGLFDEIPTQQVAEAEKVVRAAVAEQAAETIARIENGEKLKDADHKAILEAASKAVSEMETNV